MLHALTRSKSGTPTVYQPTSNHGALFPGRTLQHNAKAATPTDLWYFLWLGVDGLGFEGLGVEGLGFYGLGVEGLGVEGLGRGLFVEVLVVLDPKPSATRTRCLIEEPAAGGGETGALHVK